MTEICFENVRESTARKEGTERLDAKTACREAEHAQQLYNQLRTRKGLPVVADLFGCTMDEMVGREPPKKGDRIDDGKRTEKH